MTHSLLWFSFLKALLAANTLPVLWQLSVSEVGRVIALKPSWHFDTSCHPFQRQDEM